MIAHVFVISTGFHYYFSTLLIEHLNLENVFYVLWRPRENIDEDAKKNHQVILRKKQGMVKVLPQVIDQLAFSFEVANTICKHAKQIKFYTANYSSSQPLVEMMRWQFQIKRADITYYLIPDAAALLSDKPLSRRSKKRRERSWLVKVLNIFSTIEPINPRQQHGSYSKFLNKIYHFPAKKIFADQSKLEIIPIKKVNHLHNNTILIVGGAHGVTKSFVTEAKKLTEGLKVHYRLHPKRWKAKGRGGERFIFSGAPDWEELNIDETLEEHFLKTTYCKVIGHYSSAVLFNQLFVGNSESIFLIEKAWEDHDFHATADSYGIPVVLF